MTYWDHPRSPFSMKRIHNLSVSKLQLHIKGVEHEEFGLAAFFVHLASNPLSLWPQERRPPISSHHSHKATVLGSRGHGPMATLEESNLFWGTFTFRMLKHYTLVLGSLRGWNLGWFADNSRLDIGILRLHEIIYITIYTIHIRTYIIYHL